ncbi:MAG: hypothetical protein ACR2NM_14255, partial [Bythopirellula sp.]
MSSVLPDRERRHLLQFYIMPKLGYRMRIAVAGGLIVLGLAIQVLWAPPDVVPMLVATLPLILAGNALLLAQGFNLAPSYSVAHGEWEKTTRDRFQEIRELQDNVKRWDHAFADITCVLGFICLLGLGCLVFVIAAALATSRENAYWAPVFAADALLLFVPHWISGTRRGWRPVALREQVDALEKALQAIDGYEDPPCQIQPMFEVAGPGDSQTPIGARVFIRFPDGPKDLLGLQFQVSINDVQGTNYPYLYAVIVARKSFGLLGEPLAECHRRLPLPDQPRGLLGLFGVGKQDYLIVEDSSEKDVDVIIIRQYTTEQSGYHTDPATISNLARTA